MSKPKALQVGDLRIFAETTLAKDMPPGPQGQLSHKKGANIRMVAKVSVGGTNYGFTYPRLSRVIFSQAEKEIKASEKYKLRALKSGADKGYYIKPHTDFVIENEEALFMMMQTAFLGVLGLSSSLEALVAEEFAREPKDVKVDGVIKTPSQILTQNRPGLKKKLTEVLPTKTGKANPVQSSHDIELLDSLIKLRK